MLFIKPRVQRQGGTVVQEWMFTLVHQYKTRLFRQQHCGQICPIEPGGSSPTSMRYQYFGSLAGHHVRKYGSKGPHYRTDVRFARYLTADFYSVLAHIWYSILSLDTNVMSL